MFEIRVHGLGGQGAVTLCTWTARAGYLAGKHVQAFPFFGAERRGAPVKAFVRIDEREISLRSQVYMPDLLVVMSSDLTGMAISEGLKPGGILLINATEDLARTLAGRFGRVVMYLDATGIALSLGLEFDGMPMVNLPLFGAMVRLSEVAPLDTALEVIRDATAARGDFTAYQKAVAGGDESVLTAVPAAGEEPPPDPGSDLDMSRSGVTPIEP